MLIGIYKGGAAGNEGLGLFSLCLDWNYVGSGGSSIGALFTPLSTQLSLYFGTMICMQVLFPLYICNSLFDETIYSDRIAFCACYAANTWNGQNFPFLSQSLFFENGTLYNQLAILDSNFRLDPTKLAEAVCLLFPPVLLCFIDRCCERDCHGSPVLQSSPT